jgi:predicted CXXCH cytochrome family protein
MSKLRISLFTVFMLILMSMFAAVTFAEGFNPSKPNNPSDGNHTGSIDNQGNTNTHKTHGNFQNNTNSCANCHSTHNGENSMLIMKSGEFELCMSCHDGTMGFYDVTKGSEAGIFPEASHLSASMHNVSSGLELKAAPGALANKSTATFECSSCHNPHGSVNDRLLNETVAGVQYGKEFKVTIVGYEETIEKLSTIPTGTAAIKLNLTEDPAFAAINSSTTLSGLKITKSNGPLADPNYKYKLNYTEFCSACHDDYLQHSGVARKDGHYTHTTNSTKQGRSCIGCHYAHGTDITILKDTAGKTIADLQKTVAEGGKGWTQAQAMEYMKDISEKGSSLKRFTNMAVCWACHTSSHKIDTPAVPGGDYSGKSSIR